MNKTTRIILGIIIGILFLCMGAYIVYTFIPEDVFQFGPTATSTPTEIPPTATPTPTEIPPTPTPTEIPPTPTPEPTSEYAWIEKDLEIIEKELRRNSRAGVIVGVDYLIDDEDNVGIVITTTLGEDITEQWMEDTWEIWDVIYKNISSRDYTGVFIRLKSGKTIGASVKKLELWRNGVTDADAFIESWIIFQGNP